MTLLQAIILAIIEGLTEFLPVSSTGHMIIGSALMGIEKDEFVKLFTVAIQFGTILSVVVLYWKRFFQSIDFYIKLLAGFIPAVIAGLLFKEHIDALLENVFVVGLALFLGGIVFLFIDRWMPGGTDTGPQPITWRKAFTIGAWQCLAMVPGVSRSAATIIGGLSQGLTRKHAAEFSFFLAVPTMFAATVKSTFDYLKDHGAFVEHHNAFLMSWDLGGFIEYFFLNNIITTEQIKLFYIGNVVAFIVAIVAIRGFIGFLTKHGFKAFGWYRIAVGGVIIALHFLGIQMQMF
ncbi:MAG: undecaprenyl-diphosphate phosphatase [Flavobacteriales bacterium]|nr:undecaprenyl-diphosphate phosphatase [Flavobacteriales bacterium]